MNGDEIVMNDSQQDNLQTTAEDISISSKKTGRKVEEFEKKIAGLEKKLAESDEQFKRCVADFRNYQKRSDEEKLEFVKFANRELLVELLPAFDNLFLAEKHVEDEGLKLSIKMLKDTFERIGIMRIETEGKEYNPELMECITTGQGEENKVLEEMRPGFLLNGKVLRPAQVKVGKKN